MFKSIAFEVIGEQRLHCESCEQRVERLLKGLPGVGQVRARSDNQRIEVLFDRAGCSRPRLRSAWVKPVTRLEFASRLPVQSGRSLADSRR